MARMQGLHTEGNYQDVKIDRIDGHLITQDAQHNHIHEGRHFFTKFWFDWTGEKGSKRYVAWRTPEIEPHCEAYGKVKVSHKTSLTLYLNTVITGGDGTVGINNDLNRANIHSELFGYEDPVIVDKGIQFWSAVADKSQPMEVSTNFNYGIIMKQNNTHLWEFEKLAAQPAWVDIDFWWYEIYTNNRWEQEHYAPQRP